MICLVIHAFLWHKYKKTKLLGTFKPKLSLKLNGLFRQLYPLITMGKDADIRSFGPVVHKILYYSFTMLTSIKDHVATAMEQTLIFCILTPEIGKYLSPKLLFFLFSHTQRTGFSIILHAAWEGGIAKGYLMEDCSRGTDQAEEDSDDKDGEGDDGDDDEGAKVAENEIGDIEEKVEFRSFHDQDCSVPFGQECSPVDNFYEKTGEEPNAEIMASLDGNAMEIMQDQPEEDKVQRLDAQPHVSYFWD
jgi:hypothetical protein